MSLHWYPGHMAKATREIKTALTSIDVIIEIVDARIPFSSSNPVILQLGTEKPKIVIMSKADLADPEITQQWLDDFNESSRVKAIATCRDYPLEIQRILKFLPQLCPNKAKGPKAINAMVMGVPNVGKSTIINILADRKIAKTGNEPAITKGQQRIRLDNNIVLNDTPGILWPKIENANSSYRLGCTGAIKETAMDYDDVAFFLADYLLSTYPELIKKRYELDSIPPTSIEFFELIGASRGKLRSKGRVNLQEICKVFMIEYASGAIGRISLETPAMRNQELIEVEQRLQENEEKRAAKKKQIRKTRSKKHD